MNGKHVLVGDSIRTKYKLFQNSTSNKRGVAILLSNTLDYEILDEIRDQQENALILRIRIHSRIIILGAVYGPNRDEFDLYNFLDAVCERWKHHQIILGGDWNATYSDLPVERNPDLFSMRSLPSIARTNRILQLCESARLSDPYRCLHPDEKDYTYVPAGVLRSNRSRIDFFLISDSLYTELFECSIGQSNFKKSFDHKPVFLTFKREKKRGRKCINNRFLDNPIADSSIKLAIWYTYLESMLTVGGGVTEAILLEECDKLQQLENYCKEISQLEGNAASLDLTEEEREHLHRLKVDLEEGWTGVITYDFLQQQPRKIQDDFFFENLIKNTSEAAFRIQNQLRLAENNEKNRLIAQLVELKRIGFEENLDQILEIEGKLSKMEEKANEDKFQITLKQTS